MQTLLIATGVVALAELGDKTQLLSLVLAARYRQAWPIVLGILVATLANHAVAAWAGAWIAAQLPEGLLRWLLAASFLAVALWALKPDTISEGEAQTASKYGAFVATTIAFFLAEIGDKTQVATVVLAAKYAPLWEVVVGTTLGMMLANVPVVFLGARFAHRIPLQAARITAALVFAALAVAVLLR
jgi:putative Ca2+/H+ antiporter (TMEM165/GDT1 family)